MNNFVALTSKRVPRFVWSLKIIMNVFLILSPVTTFVFLGISEFKIFKCA